MKVTKFAVEHATAVFVLIFCLIIGGLISYSSLPREAAPDIAIPVVIVSTPYFGVSPADMETLVTMPMEKELKSLRGVKSMTSTSAESVSLVTVEFETEVNIEDALQKVREKVDKVQPDLPVDAEDSQVIEVNASDWPVLIANVSGEMDPVRLKEIGESMQDDIEKISGVLRVDLAGGVEREIQILVDPMKLRQYEININQIAGTIQSENINLPGGSIEVGSLKYLVRVPGEFKDIETIENLVVKAPEGQQVLIKDIAEVRDSYKEAETYSRLTVFEEQPDGTMKPVSRPNISLSVVKRAGENIIEIAQASKMTIEDYQRRMEPGVKVAILNDASKDIVASVHDLENNIISGMLLVLAVLFFFMGGARNAIMVAVSIPLSMLLSFIVLDAIGYTLNMVVLFSLILALGMLVDNAIVIVENIYRHASEGKTMHQAALDGTNEVGWAVIASTATTVGAFFPMVFWPGVMGSFMGYLPATVIITLISSLFVALFINPAIAAVFLKVKPGEKSKENEVPDNVIYRSYGAVLAWSLNHRAIVIALAVASFIGTFVAYGALQNGVEFFPGSTPEQFTIKIETADGTRLDDTNELIGRVADPLDGKLDLNYGFTKEELADLEPRLAKGAKLVEAWIEDAGVGGGGGFTGGGAAPHYGRISVDLIAAEQQQSDPEMFMEALRQVYSRVPGATIVLEQQAMGPPSGKPVNIEIVGDELAVQARIAQDIKEKIRGVEGIIDLDDDAELTRPEVLVRVDRKRAALLGTDTRSVASTVRTAVNGSKASVFRDGDDEYDIVVRLPKKERENIQDLLELTVSNRDGLHIPLTEVASIDVEGGSGSIRHKDQDRIVSVSANAAPGNLPADVLARVQKELDGMKVPAGYELRYAGQNKDQEEAGAFLGRAMLIALFIIAMILVTQFNSIIQPIIILSSVLLSLIGVLWSLILGNEPFGIIMTGIGTISLAGVVVNNSIVLIDYINQLRSRGMDRREAVMTSGLVRFRPVLLTAVTTVLGLMPLVLGVSVDFVNAAVVIGGRSVDLWGPMAKVVSAGLVVSTILTLVIVPVLYSFLDDLAKVGNKFIKPAAAATTAMIFGAFVLVTPQLGWTQDLPSKQAADAPAVTTPAEGDGERFSVPVDVEGEEVIVQKKEDLTPPEISGTRSLTLKQSRDLVRENNYEVKIALANIELADVTISKAYTLLFPTLAASFSTTLYDREITADLGPETIVIRPQVDYNVALSASARLNAQAWPLLQQARLNKELSKQQVILVQDELEFSVTQTYYNTLLAQRVVTISAERLANDRLSLRAVEKRLELGVARKFEVTRAKLRVAQSQLEMERAMLGFEQLRQVLAFLMQVKPDFTLEEVDNVVLAKKLDGLKETARAERPSVMLQRTAVSLSEKAKEEIYWKYLPTVDLSAAAFRPRATAFAPGEWQFSLGLNARWVLWDGGLREAELDERGAQLVVAKLRQEQNLADVNNQLDQAWAEYMSRNAQLETAASQEELANEALTESKRAYQLGAAQMLDVIFAEDQLRLTQLARAQEELQVQLAIRKLLYLAGLD